LWKYNVKNAYPNIILHDCRIIKAWIDNCDIVFEFDDSGFWICEDNKDNPFGKTLRTDKSEIRFTKYDADAVHIYIFKTFHLFGKSIFTKRIEVGLDKFIAQINCGNWQFECVDELYAWSRVGFNGYVWLRKRPYHYECQLNLFFDEMSYSWNKICEDKPW
jgi:hypothetical protein